MIWAPESATASLTLNSLRPLGVANKSKTSSRGWQVCPGVRLQSCALVRAILAAETLISLVGELFGERSSNAGLVGLLAATLLQPALAGFFARKQSLHTS